MAQTSAPLGGPPYVWIAEVAAPALGKWHATLAKDPTCGADTLATRDIAVYANALSPSPAPRTSLWPTRRFWSPAFENLYSAWIERLFDAPPLSQPSWGALHDVLRDSARNFLFDYLGAGEDQSGAVIRPDCADLPYFLRAYFAFKLGLPFGFSRCSRGENGIAPQCADFATNEDPFPPVDGTPQTLPAWADPNRPQDGPWNAVAPRFAEFLRTTLADVAQSGAGRTLATDEESDYYPVALSVDTLRPGTLYADPYGHVLVVVGRIVQSASGAGVLFAVDAQPDATVARKRFWRGNFLFAIDPTLGSAGFKHFRPIVRDGRTRHLRRVSNAELSDYSKDNQYEDGVTGFYDRVEDVLSPDPLDPMRALLETVQAFDEQVRTRVISVDNGRKFLADQKGPIDMPDGAKIFETMGPWEDFSTPSRDLRLLIAIDTALGFPSQVQRRPERYATAVGTTASQVRRELDERLTRELHERTFAYTRSDGTSWSLSLMDVTERAVSFETAYNPNECVEWRWGAPARSDEAAPCLSHPPDAQVAKMRSYQEWFHDRRRPPR